MRDFTESEQSKIEKLTDLSISLTYLEPTLTGLSKSIMDATTMVRLYLKDNDIHDYSRQAKGSSEKVIVNGYILTETEIISAPVSLYRPETKNGDPRIWVSGLNYYARGNDIVCLIVRDSEIYVFNLTQINLLEILQKKNSPLYDFLMAYSYRENIIPDELLKKLREIANLGPIETLVNADTGVGRTLEKYLGIKMNPSKDPDFKGIEIKSFRGLAANRVTLFAQVPNWELSKFKSSKEILNHFGYTHGGIFKLYCTVTTAKPNPQGLFLKVDEIRDYLVESSSNKNIGDFALWKMELLRKRLLDKHRETFWIKAESSFINGKEYYSYKEAVHTKKPIKAQFGPLIEQSLITLDHLIKKNANGTISEKGPLFRIKENAISLLMPSPKHYKLINN